MPASYTQDDNNNNSSFRLVWIPLMAVLVFFLLVLFAVLLYALAKNGQNISEIIKALGITGGTGIGGLVVSAWRKLIEKKPSTKPEVKPAEPVVQPSVVQPPVSSFRSIPDRQLTRNFRLYEFIEANPYGDIEFMKINWENIHQIDQSKVKLMAEHMQWVRDLINERYRSRNNGLEIGLYITSAWRCTQWELMKGRDGSSQHARIAADFQPRTQSPELAVTILKDLHGEWNSLSTGHQGGLAIKHPERNAFGDIIKIGFLHLDFGGTRRWTY